MKSRHILSFLLENDVGLLSRVVGLFSARGYEIESINASPTEIDNVSRMTIVSLGEESVIEQITKHLNRIIGVIKVVNISDAPSIERGLMMVKVRVANARDKDEVYRTTEIFRGHIIEATEKTYCIEVTGPKEKLDAFLQALDKDLILEVVQTGVTGIGRGERVLRL